jgi:hypothetical protein
MLFLSTRVLINRRSVRTTAVCGPNLSEKIPPYCRDHSVNLGHVTLVSDTIITFAQKLQLTSHGHPSWVSGAGFQSEVVFWVLFVTRESLVRAIIHSFLPGGKFRPRRPIKKKVYPIHRTVQTHAPLKARNARDILKSFVVRFPSSVNSNLCLLNSIHNYFPPFRTTALEAGHLSREATRPTPGISPGRSILRGCSPFSLF